MGKWDNGKKLRIVRRLLDNGANPNAIIPSQDWLPISVPPLFLAAQSGSVELTDLLLERGAKVSVEDEYSVYLNAKKGRRCLDGKFIS